MALPKKVSKMSLFKKIKRVPATLATASILLTACSAVDGIKSTLSEKIGQISDKIWSVYESLKAQFKNPWSEATLHVIDTEDENKLGEPDNTIIIQFNNTYEREVPVSSLTYENGIGSIKFKGADFGGYITSMEVSPGAGNPSLAVEFSGIECEEEDDRDNNNNAPANIARPSPTPPPPQGIKGQLNFLKFVEKTVT